MNLPAFLGYFVFVIIIQIALVPYIRKLAETDPNIKPLTNSYGIMRPLRFISTLPVLRRREKIPETPKSDGE